jgi:hypothetical protein
MLYVFVEHPTRSVVGRQNARRELEDFCRKAQDAMANPLRVAFTETLCSVGVPGKPEKEGEQPYM